MLRCLEMTPQGALAGIAVRFQLSTTAAAWSILPQGNVLIRILAVDRKAAGPWTDRQRLTQKTGVFTCPSDDAGRCHVGI